MMHLKRTAALALVAAAMALTAPAAGAQQQVPVGGLAQAVFNYVFSPGAVAGANVAGCRPSAAHPYPVVLVHGTFENMGFNWAALAPTLANAGYCVYALNYGQTALSLGMIDGLGDIAASAGQLSTFVNQVLAQTGASQVDIVGHSQGGMMPNYYLKFLSGAAKVHMLVGLAPSNHGTTLDGLVTLGSELDGVLGSNIVGSVAALLGNAGAPAIAEQEAGSPFETHLFAGGDTVPGPRYVVIETRDDTVVTPYTNAFLSGAQNILIQNQCPLDTSSHVGLVFDSPAIQDVLNALGADSATFRPVCS
jgi:triacylglycerol esterase/lipase EstA (alpha/beta hydrolase family)